MQRNYELECRRRWENDLRAFSLRLNQGQQLEGAEPFEEHFKDDGFQVGWGMRLFPQGREVRVDLLVALYSLEGNPFLELRGRGSLPDTRFTKTIPFYGEAVEFRTSKRGRMRILNKVEQKIPDAWIAVQGLGVRLPKLESDLETLKRRVRSSSSPYGALTPSKH